MTGAERSGMSASGGRRRTRLRRVLVPAAPGLLLLGLIAPAGAAAPTAPGPFPTARTGRPPTGGPATEGLSDQAGEVARLETALDLAAARAEAADLQLARAVEDFNEARTTLRRREAAARAAAGAADAAQAEADRLRRDLARVAVSRYRSGADLSGVALVLTAADGEDPLAQVALLQSWAVSRADVVDRVRAAVVVAQRLRRDADAALDQQAAAAARASQTRRAAQQVAESTRVATAHADAERNAAVRRLAELTRTTVAEQERRQAQRAESVSARPPEQSQPPASDAASPTRASTSSRPQPPPRPRTTRAEPPRHSRPGTTARPRTTSRPEPPRTTRAPASRPPRQPTPRPQPDPPSDGVPAGGVTRGSAADGRAAVAWARTQLGKPYEWGADGPETYDCSGLTMRAWQAAGVSLSHSSRYQFRQVRKVPIAQARPGDLLFWGSDPDDPDSIHHVALALGGGLMLEAPETGKTVRVTTIRQRHLLPWAGRP